MANELDAQADARREAAKVIPIYRTGTDRVPRDHLRTLEQQAPNVFVNKRPDAA